MRSIRSKITLLTVLGITVAIGVATVISAFSSSNLGHSSSEQTLALLCETGKSNINYYFKSVEQSVDTVSNLIDDDLDSIDEANFNAEFTDHMDEARTIFGEAAYNTNGALTYYYRIDPSITATTGEKGFWYTNLDGKGFVEHEVTDLSDDQFECIWFYKPKETGKPLWLPPYLTDNLDVYVLSYNVPVYRNETTFIGVVGIEIDYGTMGQQIKDIKVQNSGYAYIVDNETGSIIYHPYLDILNMPEDERPSIPPEFLTGFKNGQHHIEYTFQGVKKHSYWTELSNGMSIVVCVPVIEIAQVWLKVVIQIIIAAVITIAVFVVITILFTRRFTKPLKELTEAAENINEGNYDVKLDYKDNDEIGVLTTTFNKLITHLGGYITDLTSMAYADALTEVQNKGAFDIALRDIQDRLDKDEHVEFAIAFFDCDDLKRMNDKYGHDKGNVYLKNSSHLIGRVFNHSSVYRLGGDEFAVILQGVDYEQREALKTLFIEMSNEICAFAKEEWEKVRVSVGLATYDPEVDKSAEDVAIHADHLMYEHKRARKKKEK